MSDEKIFKNALISYVRDFASGDAIRHLADKGYTVEEISGRLDFPIEREEIGKIVWQRYLDTGVIALKDPAAQGTFEEVSYEKVQGRYGKVSFKQVKKQMNYTEEYVACDLGKKLYKDRESVVKRLSGLNENELEYVLGLPWPLETVWHKKDARIVRILEALAR